MLMEKENGTFIGFQDGEMLFEDNVPSDKINSIQKGILEYVKDARELLGDDGGDFAFCNEIVSYMFNGKIDICENIKEAFWYDDSYLGELDKVRIWK